MNVRPPAVAGAFYEGTAEGLRVQVQECLDANPPVQSKQRFVGGVVPHAGLMYSGHVAAAFYSRAELPKRFIILCPNHTGFGHFAAINREGAWKTPLGEVPIDTLLADALMSHSKILAEDWRAHAREHALEVQLPFLQMLIPDFTFVPICLGAHRYDYCEDIGRRHRKGDHRERGTRRYPGQLGPEPLRRPADHASKRSVGHRRGFEARSARAVAGRRRVTTCRCAASSRPLPC